MPFNGLLALPVQVSAGPVAAYNFAILASLVLSALGAYLLARDRLARVGALPGGGWGELPPFAAGLLFGFSPYMADHLLSHLNLIAAEGLPFAILALLHAGEGGWGLGVGGWQSQNAPTPNPQPPTSRRGVVGAALALLVTGLCDWQYVLFLALWTALWGLWTVGGAFGRRGGETGRGAGRSSRRWSGRGWPGRCFCCWSVRWRWA